LDERIQGGSKELPTTIVMLVIVKGSPSEAAMRCFIAVAVLLLATGAGRADTPVPQPWPLEVVVLRNGAILRGLILENSNGTIRFQCVERHKGRATVSFRTVFSSAEVEHVEPLPAEQRLVLQAHLKELEQSTPEGEKERMEGLDLEAIPWGNQGAGAWRYASDYFTLTSTAPQEIVRRAALRLEQIYVAYSRYLPPRHKGAAPTAVLLLTDKAEYQKLLSAQKLQLVNLAFYDPAANRIVCYSDLQLLGERLIEVRQRHREVRSALESKRAEFAKLYKGRELERMCRPINVAESQLARADSENDKLFAKETAQLFATLYHESFHAYLANFVYPPKVIDMPRWLNEGLAQIFETAVVEGQELRVGHADEARLARAKDASAKGELVPLADLLRSDRNRFALNHIVDRQVSDRHYLTSWALAFYLTFERRMLGSAALDAFVKHCAEGIEPGKAFEELIGEPLSKF
jgi:hypothetical protein